MSFDGLASEWQIVCQSFGLSLTEARDNRALCVVLMQLVATADEASEGVGAPMDQAADGDDDLIDLGSIRLTQSGTLCLEIDPSRLRVLPRMHTPQNGLTERSLSLYLSLCEASEVTPQWHPSPFRQTDSLNLLLIPWPFEVVANEFHKIADTAARLPKDFGFFTFAHQIERQPDNLTELVEALHAEAKRKLGRIDGVVLPELSITEQQFNALRQILPQDCFLIAGAGRGDSGGLRGTNQVRLSFPQLADVVQRKHHPWKLDESQVIQYGLGGVLSPYREWWEYIDCTDRCLNFISISEDLVVCALVCEDLARPDPVANIVRAVGPNLVIALLMDGPQTKERWAARYATVLADDPGCSVLALTSLGMTQLSRPKTPPSRSRIVALWKDRFNGATEIELPPGLTPSPSRYRPVTTRSSRPTDAETAAKQPSRFFLACIQSALRQEHKRGRLGTWQP
jgi:predicted amidohydrolase